MRRSPLAAALVLAACLLFPAAGQAAAATADPFSSEAFNQLAAAVATPNLPVGFTSSAVWSGLNTPTAVRFAPNGHVFVALKGGIVDEFDSLADTTPTVRLDIRGEVDDFIDRGLLGLAIDPQFTTGRPYLYVLYTLQGPPTRHGSRPGTTTARIRPAPTAAAARRLAACHGSTPTGPSTS